MKRLLLSWLAPLLFLLLGTHAGAGARAAAKDDAVEIPFILWGGDAATFLANGGLETKPDSIFGKHGLSVKLKREDDFGKQVEAYLKGTSPFLRGTMSMFGQA